MPQFLKFLLASCLGTTLALIVLGFLGIGFITSLATNATEAEKVAVKPNSVLELDFANLIPEKTNNTPIDAFDFEQTDVVGLHDMVRIIQQAKEDPDIKGIYFNASNVMAGKAACSTLHAALTDFKSSGKFVISYANYYTQNAYYLASTADSILLNPIGAIDLRGLSSMIAFYKGMLDKLDIQYRVFYVGQFKSATEPYRLEKMSDQNRLQIREYLGALNDILMRDIAQSRGVSESSIREIANRFDGRSAQTALQARLIDRICYEDDAFASMKKRIGLDLKEKLNRIKLEDYHKTKGFKTDFSTSDKIAVVYAEGTILDGEDGEPGDTYDGKYVKLLRKIRQDDNIKAVVLRVNSPGGSVLASENILRELDLCQQAGKPLVVSMGDVAASGGYYISCHADSIFAEPNTLTGSIGVFGMVPILQKTMKENLGITFDTVRTGKFSAFGTPFIDFSEEEGRIIQDRVQGIYDDFLTKVAEGRGKKREEIHEIAQGRVWVGSKAKTLGLVDDLGGLERAIGAAAKLAGLEKYRTTEYPRAQTGLEQFMDRFSKKKNREDQVKTALVRSELSEFYPFYKTLRDLRRSEGIQARLPFDVIVR